MRMLVVQEEESADGNMDTSDKVVSAEQESPQPLLQHMPLFQRGAPSRSHSPGVAGM